MLLESCAEGHRASKSSRDPKIVGYNPRKGPEMVVIMSFADTTRVMYQGHRASKSSRDPKNMVYNPRKRKKMLEIKSFVDPARVVYTRSQGIEIIPGLENHGL